MYKEEFETVIDKLTPKQIEEVYQIISIFFDRSKSLIKETVEALSEKGFEISINQVQQGGSYEYQKCKKGCL